jgi:hypothetical protein
MTRHVPDGGTYSTHMPVRIHIQRLRPCEQHSARRRRLSAEATAVRTWTEPSRVGPQAAVGRPPPVRRGDWQPTAVCIPSGKLLRVARAPIRLCSSSTSSSGRDPRPLLVGRTAAAGAASQSAPRGIPGRAARRSWRRCAHADQGAQLETPQTRNACGGLHSLALMHRLCWRSSVLGLVFASFCVCVCVCVRLYSSSTSGPAAPWATRATRRCTRRVGGRRWHAPAAGATAAPTAAFPGEAAAGGRGEKGVVSRGCEKGVSANSDYLTEHVVLECEWGAGPP